MAGKDGRRRRSRQTAAVMLVLCAFAQSLTCFSLRGLSEKVKQDEVDSGATVKETRTGRILFNGKELNAQSGSASAAATGNDGLLHIDSDKSNGRWMLERTSQLGDNMADEAAWRRLNSSLHCGQSKMKLKAMGPRAGDLQLDMGDARSLPLIQVPEPCGYSMQQNALGLVLVVPYDGCSVIQEDGNYVLPMSWLESSVKLTCPTPASTPPKPAQQPWKLPFPHKPSNLNRQRRQATQPLSMYYPSSAYYSAYYSYWYYYMMAAAAATAKPDTTTITTKPSTEKPPQTRPPVYPYNPYYPYYYHPYYYPYYYPVTTTTAKPTTGPATSGMTTPTTKTSQKPPHPYYPYYFYYPMGHQVPGMPNNTDIYYYPIIQHFYGRHTTVPPTVTTTTQGEQSSTTKQSGSSSTKKPTTSSASTTTTTVTTKPCSSTTKPSSGKYPGPMSPFVDYTRLPFAVQVSYNRAGKLPDDQKYMLQAGYKSGLQARAHPGFNYWQPVPWFPHSPGKEAPQFDWGKLPQHN